MKKIIYYLALALATGMIFAGCGGGGGDSSSSSGTISMNITDAKPMLPVGNVESVSITFDEVSVHKSGGGWVTLPAVQQPYTLDLYQFSDGTKTRLVPPVQLESGKYTQVRIGVTRGTIKIEGRDPLDLEIPSENLKTDKNFDFTVQGGGAVDLTVDFDLSQSIVATGSETYQLKPVLHLVTTTEAWTIKGYITSSLFDSIPDDPKEAVVIVYRNLGQIDLFEAGVDEEYTRLSVPKGISSLTEFIVFWLVPGENYYIEVYLGDPAVSTTPKYSDFIDASEWGTSKTLSLRGGASLFEVG